jgi:hypothetical protein
MTSATTLTAVGMSPAPRPERVEDAADVRERRVLAHERGMNEELGRALVRAADRDGFHDEAEAIRHRVIDRLQVRDALGRDFVGGYGHPEGEHGQHREFVLRVPPPDVEGRIGLGVSEPLRFCQRVREARVLALHLREDEIAGAVDDAREALDRVAREGVLEDANERDSAADRRFEREVDAVLLREVDELRAVEGEQHLVRGDDLLLLLDRHLHVVARRVGAAHHLDDDVDGVVAEHVLGARRHERAVDLARALLVLVAHERADDDRLGADALGEASFVLGDEPYDPAAHRAATK